jgi:DNA-binding XRE family transcriptional regulator
VLTLPVPVTRVLRKLGHDMKDARRRRRIPMAIAAERASISKPTFIKVERGDPNVSMASYATILYVLGLGDRLGDVAAAKNDPVGLQLEEENLPKRIHRAGTKKLLKGK